jgi:hypothetical protein
MTVAEKEDNNGNFARFGINKRKTVKNELGAFQVLNLIHC